MLVVGDPGKEVVENLQLPMVDHIICPGVPENSVNLIKGNIATKTLEVQKKSLEKNGDAMVSESDEEECEEVWCDADLRTIRDESLLNATKPRANFLNQPKEGQRGSS